MVEFIRDVIIVVAILVTLIAFALHPGPEADASLHSATLTDRVNVSGAITPSAHAAIPNKGASASALAK
jgi:hypothetical protein